MLISCWSAKGGSGTTVVAAAIALRLARSVPVVLADLAGDLPLVLGGPEPADDHPGLVDWLAAGPDVADTAIDRLMVSVSPRLSLLPRGVPRAEVVDDDSAGSRLAAALAARGTVVADCGLITPGSPSWTVAAEAVPAYSAGGDAAEWAVTGETTASVLAAYREEVERSRALASRAGLDQPAAVVIDDFRNSRRPRDLLLMAAIYTRLFVSLTAGGSRLASLLADLALFAAAASTPAAALDPPSGLNPQEIPTIRQTPGTGRGQGRPARPTGACGPSGGDWR